MSMTTELAQREKFEAWWEINYHNGNPPRFGWSYWREGDGYKIDDDESELDGMWEAWKAASVALVEALEKEKGYASAYEAEKWHYHGLAESEGERANRAEARLEAAEKRIAELEARDIQPLGVQLITEAIGAHGYIVGCLQQNRPDLALEESLKWVQGISQAAVMATEGE
ncbi:TPA: hypothetical protein ACGR33_003507 [Escherichia coli]